MNNRAWSGFREAVTWSALRSYRNFDSSSYNKLYIIHPGKSEWFIIIRSIFSNAETEFYFTVTIRRRVTFNADLFISPFHFFFSIHRRLSVQGAKLSSSAEEECCRFGEYLLPVWLVALDTTKGSQRQTVDDLRQAIRCFHKRQHAHVCKRHVIRPQGHLKIASAGSEKKVTGLLYT